MEGNRRPWGKLVALVTGAVVTAVGVARGLDPEVIVFRAAVSAVLLGVVAASAGAVVNRFLREK